MVPNQSLELDRIQVDRPMYTLRMGLAPPDRAFLLRRSFTHDVLCRGFNLHPWELYDILDWLVARIQEDRLQDLSLRKNEDKTAFGPLLKELKLTYPKLSDSAVHTTWSNLALWAWIRSARDEVKHETRIQQRSPGEFVVNDQGEIKKRKKPEGTTMWRFADCIILIRDETVSDGTVHTDSYPLRTFLSESSAEVTAREDVDLNQLSWDLLREWLDAINGFDEGAHRVCYTAADVVDFSVADDVSLHNAVVRMRWDASEAVQSQEFNILRGLTIVNQPET